MAWVNWGTGGGAYPSEQTEYWVGDDGEEYTKDQYGNVYSQYGFEGNDVYSGGGGGGYGGTPSVNPYPPGYSGFGASPYLSQPTPVSPVVAPAGYGGGGVPQYNYQQDSLRVEREKLAAQVQQNQAYQAYLNQQLQQQNLNEQQRIAIERERVQIERENQALRQQQFELEKQADEFKRAMQVRDIMANPRSLVQSLMLLGANQAQAAGYLQNTPLVQQLGAQPGVGQDYGWAPPQGGLNLDQFTANMQGIPDYNAILQSSSAAGGAGQIDPTTGRNTLFPFITGRKLPVRQTLSDIETNNPRAGAIASLASFSGQDPNAFFGEFQSYLPKGSTLGPASVR